MSTFGEQTEQGLSLEGTIRQVNYKRRELSVVAQCQIWQFRLAPDCQMYFDNEQAILRCFHPLDQVRIVYVSEQPKHIALAMYAWEQKAAA